MDEGKQKLNENKEGGNNTSDVLLKQVKTLEELFENINSVGEYEKNKKEKWVRLEDAQKDGDERVAEVIRRMTVLEHKNFHEAKL